MRSPHVRFCSCVPLSLAWRAILTTVICRDHACCTAAVVRTPSSRRAPGPGRRQMCRSGWRRHAQVGSNWESW
eukprot:7382374-Prymnesium_polylepis.3